MAEKYVAVDVGSSNGKIYTGELIHDRTLDIQEVGRFETPRMMYQNHLCINVYGIYEQVLKVLTELGRAGVKIRSLGVDTWASDFGIIDEQGIVQGIPVFYRDTRTEHTMEYVEEKIGYRRLYELTTQRKLKDTTLHQLIALLRENPEALGAGKKILFLGDLLMYLLSGNPVSEISAASYSQMFSMRKENWEDEVFDVFGVPKSAQPKVVPAGTRLGLVEQSIADWCGTNRFQIVAPAVHDTSSAGVVVPVDERKNWAFIATGTWFLVSMELPEPADNEMSYRYNLSNTALAFGKTLCKRNVMAMWLIQECRRKWNEMGMDLSFPEIVERAVASKPFAGVVDTECNAFFNPQDMPREIVKYLSDTGQGCFAETDVGQIARIIYESVALKCAYALEALKKTTGRQVDTLYIIGGANAVTVLNQYIANVTNTEVITGAKEASCAGNILLQAYGMGEVESEEEIREISRNTFPQTHYYPEDTEIWKEQYIRFCEICRLEPV